MDDFEKKCARLVFAFASLLCLGSACDEPTATGDAGSNGRTMDDSPAEAGSPGDADTGSQDAGHPEDAQMPDGNMDDRQGLRMWPHRLVPHRDGILVVGSTGSMAVARFTADGALDRTFGKDGVAAILHRARDTSAATASVGVTTSVGPEALTALVTEDAIYVGGQLDGAQGSAALVVGKLTHEGTLVEEFGMDGLWEHSIGNARRGAISELFALADGELLAVGDAERERGYGRRWLTVRLAPDGTPATPLADNEPPGLLGFGDQVTGAYLEDEVLTLGGIVFEVGRVSLSMGRDNAFGEDGIASVEYEELYHSEVFARRPTGQLLVAGSHPGDVADGVRVAQFTAAGAPDPSFGDRGEVVLSPGGLKLDPVGAAVLSDGRLLLYLEGTSTRLVMLREDGSLDPSFGGEGILSDRSLEHGQPALIGEHPDGHRMLVHDGQVWLAGRVASGTGAGDYVLWLHRMPL